MEEMGQCPHCGHEIAVVERLLGKPIACPRCHHTVVVIEAPLEVPKREFNLREFVQSQTFRLPAAIAGGFILIACTLLWWKVVLAIFILGSMAAFGYWRYDKAIKRRIERDARMAAAEEARRERRLGKVTCSNCLLETPRTKFCGNCGAELPPPSRQERLRQDNDDSYALSRRLEEKLEQIEDEHILRGLSSTKGKGRRLTIGDRIQRALGCLIISLGLIGAIGYGIHLSGERLKAEKERNEKHKKDKQDSLKLPDSEMEKPKSKDEEE